MNSLQEKQLEILKSFIQVCDQLDLKYYLVNGSALGAAKYGGFIPWDDDIDVALPRADYELFIQKAQELLPSQIFLQNYKTDKYFPQLYSKLRNSQTTYIENGTKHLNINHGVFIDVFPLDFYNENQKQAPFKRIKRKLLGWIQACALNDTSSKKIVFRNKIFKFLGFNKKTQKYLKGLEELIIDSSTSKKYLCNYSDSLGKRKTLSEWFEKGELWEFEGVKVTLPKDVESYLTYKYNDWRAALPYEQQKGHHYYTVCDLEKPYTEHIKNHKFS